MKEHRTVPRIIIFYLILQICTTKIALQKVEASFSHCNPNSVIKHKYKPQSGTTTIKLQKIFLDEVEQTISTVFQKIGNPDTIDIESLQPMSKRESLGVANRLNIRLNALNRNNDCRRCWLQRRHCVCETCIPLEDHNNCMHSQKVMLPNITTTASIGRIFLLMHHKEIGLAVDTAKYILAALPGRCRLVVGGIGEEYQPSMKEMMDSMRSGDTNHRQRCLVLFPTEDAKPFQELLCDFESNDDSSSQEDAPSSSSIQSADDTTSKSDGPYDIVVIDGTWSQARKLHSRLPTSANVRRVCLSDEAVKILGSSTNDHTCNNNFASDIMPATGCDGRQLRRHPIKWREVSTLEATRLLLRDMNMAIAGTDSSKSSNDDDDSNTVWGRLKEYQCVGDQAARRQLGPPRAKESAL